VLILARDLDLTGFELPELQQRVKQELLPPER